MAVENLAPSIAQRDWELKRKLYTSYGVRECWLVDPESNSVDVLELGEDELVLRSSYSRDAVDSSPLFPHLTLSLCQVFPPLRRGLPLAAVKE